MNRQDPTGRPTGNMRRGMDRRNRVHRSMNFEEYASEGNHFINQVARELDCSRNQAARVTRAVLHAIRDRIPPDNAVQFGQGLPMALKGVYFDQYDISRTPVVIRRAEDFILFVRNKNYFAAIQDFPDPESVVEALQAVFRVLEMHLDPGQINQVKRILHGDIVKLIEPANIYQ